MVNRRQFLTGAIAATASVSLAGCGGSEGSSSGRFTFSYLRPTWGPATFTKNGPYEKALEKSGKVGIEAQVIPVVDYDTKVNTILASGDIPDVLWGSGPGVPVWRDAQAEGAFLPIDDYLDRYPALRKAVPDNIWDRLKSDDGETFFVPNLIWPEIPFALHYRRDLLKKARIDEPTTTSEFVDMLRAVKKAYPDRVPMTVAYEWSFKDLATSFDFCQSGWEPDVADPKRIVPWFTKEKEIDFYFWVQGLHKEGLIDPEFKVNKDLAFADNKFKAGKAVVLPATWSGLPDMVPDLRKVDPQAEVGIFAPLGEFGGNRQVIPIDRGFYVSAKMADPDRFFEFLNWTLTDGSTFRRYGVKGKMYKEEGGEKIPILESQRESEYKQPQHEPLGFLGPFSEKLDWKDLERKCENADVADQFPEIKERFGQFTARFYADYRDVTKVSETESKKGKQLEDDYLRQVIDSAIIAHGSTKKKWVEAVEKWRKAGGDRIVDEVNEVQKDKSKPNWAKS